MPASNPNLVWQRSLNVLAALALTVVIVVAMYWARPVFIPVTMAVFLAFVLSPLELWLRRLGMGKAPTVLLTAGIAGVVVIGVIGIVAWQLTELTMTLPEKSEVLKAKAASVKSYFGSGGENRFGKMIDEITNVIAPKPAKDPNSTTLVVESNNSSWMSDASLYLSPLTEILGQAAFAIVLSVFLLWKRDDLRNRLIRLIGDSRLTTATKAVDDASRRISRYLFMQLLLNTAFGIAIVAAMFIIGVPYALLWGAIASLMRYVPYLGTWLGLIPAVIMTVAFTDTVWQPLAVIGVYAVLELACNNYFEPRLYGKSMGLSEVAQLIAAAFWAFLWGPVGLILSGPLTVVLLVLGKNVTGLKFFEILLGDEPVLSTDVRFYQRLAALDQDEAWDIIREEMKTRSLTEIDDSILMPALAYAKRDREQEQLTEADLAAMTAILQEIIEDTNEIIVVPAAKPAVEPNRIRVLLIPAKDKSDEIASRLLKDRLDADRWEVDVAPSAHLASEMVEKANAFQPAVIIITTLPPGGFSHTRYVCKRLSKQYPDAQLVVNRCEAPPLPEDSTGVLKEAGAAHITNGIAATVHHLNTWMEAFQNSAKATVEPREVAAIGTPTANSTNV